MTAGPADYPPLLREIPDPPLVLYVRGDSKVLSRHTVAMVGTRRPTAYGLQVARRLARDLAERQLVIASGLARGIDSAAHHGALEGAGKTVARSEEHTSELQSLAYLVCRLLLEKKKQHPPLDEVPWPRLSLHDEDSS